MPCTESFLQGNSAKILSFEPNYGQTDKAVSYLARGLGYNLFLTSNEAVVKLHSRASTDVFHLAWLGANTTLRINGVDKLPGKNNYFVGNDPKKWLTNLPIYAKVEYQAIYPRINLVLYGNQRQLEYDKELTLLPWEVAIQVAIP